MKEIGFRIRSARKEKKMTQADLADKIGCSLVTMGCIESGKNVSSWLIEKACDELGLELKVITKEVLI